VTAASSASEQRQGCALADLTWPEAADRAGAGAVLAVPLGSTEQHGPHLPSSTDTDLAQWLCLRLSGERDQVVVAPPLGYGSSGEHAGFAGTLSIGQAALELLLVELGRSASEPLDRMLLVSGHGGNAEPLHRAERRLRAESRDVLGWLPRWNGDAHAGHSETSMQLALAPGRVRLGRARPGNTRPIGELAAALREVGVAGLSENGVLGDPSGANAADGDRLLAGLLDDLVNAFDAWLGPAG